MTDTANKDLARLLIRQPVVPPPTEPKLPQYAKDELAWLAANPAQRAQERLEGISLPPKAQKPQVAQAAGQGGGVECKIKPPEAVASPNGLKPKTHWWNAQERKVLTLTQATALGELIGIGTPVAVALRALNVGMCLDSFYECLQRQPEMREWFETTKAKQMVNAIKSIYGTTARTMPTGTCWLYERRFPELFAKRPDTNVNVTNNTAVISPEIWQKAQQLLGRPLVKSHEPITSV